MSVYHAPLTARHQGIPAMTSNFESILTEIQLTYPAKLEKLSERYCTSRFFYTSFSKEEVGRLRSSISKTEFDEGDIAQLYFTIRNLETIYGPFLDALVESTNASLKSIYGDKAVPVDWWGSVLVFVRTAKELGLLSVSDTSKKE